jgi:hypothetical protein
VSRKTLALLRKAVTLLRKIVSLLKITAFGEDDALSAKKRQKKSRLAKPTDSKAKTVILRQQNKTA